MPDEAVLREKARAAVQSGKIPALIARGEVPGRGAPCAICGVPVTKDEMEFEIQFAHDDTPGVEEFRVHLRCFVAWEFEPQQGEAVGAAGSSRGQRASASHFEAAARFLRQDSFLRQSLTNAIPTLSTWALMGHDCPHGDERAFSSAPSERPASRLTRAPRFVSSR
jgi:hypothetical protein